VYLIVEADMSLLFLEWLARLGVHIPAAFDYTSTRIVLAAMTALLMALGIGPWFIAKLRALHIGQSIRKEEAPKLGELHKAKEATPTMGGILILAAVLVAMVLWMDWRSSVTWVLAGSLVWLGCLGAYDDYLKIRYKNARGLRSRWKFVGQLLLCGLVALYMIWNAGWCRPLYFPFFKEPVMLFCGLGVVGFLIWVALVVAGTSNAVNLTDGLDGLASGCLVIAASVFAIFAFVSNHVEVAHYLQVPVIEGSGEVAIFLAAMAGAVLGFLWYNGHPAQVFMGDTGSLPLGGLLGICALMLQRELLLALVGGIFVLEALSVMLQVASFRLRNKRRLFLCAPLHHHFEYMGWAETKVVVRFWILSLFFGLLGLSTLKLQ
jgi:phospho-N-acetylmuramoyl-pentapeptide-transferase